MISKRLTASDSRIVVPVRDDGYTSTDLSPDTSKIPLSTPTADYTPKNGELVIYKYVQNLEDDNSLSESFGNRETQVLLIGDGQKSVIELIQYQYNNFIQIPKLRTVMHRLDKGDAIMNTSKHSTTVTLQSDVDFEFYNLIIFDVTMVPNGSTAETYQVHIGNLCLPWNVLNPDVPLKTNRVYIPLASVFLLDQYKAQLEFKTPFFGCSTELKITGDSNIWRNVEQFEVHIFGLL